MARMIYADDLYEAMNQVGAFEVLKDKRKEMFTSAWGVPIVDAEEVVRCKDCKSYRFYEGAFGKGWICFKTNNKRSADDFCSRGERRNG